MNARQTNARSAMVGGAICLTLIVAIAALTADPSNDTVARRPSTFFTDDTGTRALYLVLEEVLGGVEQWRRPLSDLLGTGRRGAASLIVMGPSIGLGVSEAAALDRWIASGGQLILATSEPWPVEGSDEGSSTGYLARHGIESIDFEGGAGAIDLAVVAPVGQGRIVYVPDRYAFSNRTLGLGEGAIWMAERCAEWGGDVMFDEFHHGFGQQRTFRQVMVAFLISPWGLACSQLALAGMVYLLGSRRRFGQAIEPLPPERTSPIETVDALGGLFEAAEARALSARTLHQYLNTRLSAHLGRPIDLANPEVRRQVAARLGGVDAVLDSYAENMDTLREGQAGTDAQLVAAGHDAATILRSYGSH